MKEIDLNNIEEGFSLLKKEKEITMINNDGIYEHPLTITEKNIDIIKFEKLLKKTKFKNIIFKI